MPEDDPTSPSHIGAHVLALLLLMMGGCLLDYLRRLFHPPLVTEAIVGIGEVVILIYMLGSIGQALRWSYKQWTGEGSKRSDQQQVRSFLPTWSAVGSVFKLNQLTRLLIVAVITLGVMLLIGELTGNTDIPSPHPGLNFINPKVYYDFIRWVSARANVISSFVATLSLATAIIVINTIWFKWRHSHLS